MLVRISFFAALGGFLFGYDLGLIGGALLGISEELEITASFKKEAIVGALKFGAFVGTFLGGALMLRYGRRKAISMTAITGVLGPIIMATGTNTAGLVVGRVASGLGIGASAIVVPAYLAELAPAAHRGAMVQVYEVMLTLGMLCATVMDYALQHVGPHGWRWMVGLPAIPGAIIGLALFLLPESPRYLVMQGQLEAALHTLQVCMHTSNLRSPWMGRLKVAPEKLLADAEDELLLLWSSVEKDRHMVMERRAALMRSRTVKQRAKSNSGSEPLLSGPPSASNSGRLVQTAAVPPSPFSLPRQREELGHTPLLQLQQYGGRGDSGNKEADPAAVGTVLGEQHHHHHRGSTGQLLAGAHDSVGTGHQGTGYHQGYEQQGHAQAGGLLQSSSSPDLVKNPEAEFAGSHDLASHVSFARHRHVSHLFTLGDEDDHGDALVTVGSTHSHGGIAELRPRGSAGSASHQAGVEVQSRHSPSGSQRGGGTHHGQPSLHGPSHLGGNPLQSQYDHGTSSDRAVARMLLAGHTTQGEVHADPAKVRVSAAETTPYDASLDDADWSAAEALQATSTTVLAQGRTHVSGVLTQQDLMPGKERHFGITLLAMMLDIKAVLQGPEARACVITCVLAIFNQATASTAIINYAPTLLRSIGSLSAGGAMAYTIVIAATKVLGVCFGLVTVDFLGRRPLLICGAIGCAAAMGLATLFTAASSSAGLLISMCAFILSFSMSWAGVYWVVVSEVFSMAVKSPASSLATSLLFLSGAVTNMVFLALVDSLHEFAFLVFMGVALASAAYAWLQLPETKGRTLADVQVLINTPGAARSAKQIPSRQQLPLQQLS